MRKFKEEKSLEDMSLSIVGGTGGMGRLFSKIFRSLVKEVAICSRTFEKAKRIANNLKVSAWPIKRCAEADIVLVSVPIEETYEICRNILREMNENSLLIELSSVKHGIADRLSKVRELGVKNIEYLSLHPLFGPRIRSMKERRIVVIPVKSGPIGNKVLKCLRNEGAMIVESEVEEHDKTMAIVQASHHFAFLTLLNMEEFLKVDLNKFRTESLKGTEKTLKMIIENLDTILAIQKINPYAEDTRKKFIESAGIIGKMNSESENQIRKVINKYSI